MKSEEPLPEWLPIHTDTSLGFIEARVDLNSSYNLVLKLRTTVAGVDYDGAILLPEEAMDDDTEVLNMVVTLANTWATHIADTLTFTENI